MDALRKEISVRFCNMGIISALMVVAIHVLKRGQELYTPVWWLRQLTCDGVCRIAVPFFFLAAGYFVARHLNEHNYWCKEICKRIKSLLVPFLVWSFVAFILCSGLRIVGNVMNDREWYENLFTLKRLLVSSGLYPYSVPELRQLWFVRVLFVFMLFLPVFKFLSRSIFGVCAFFIVFIVVKPFGAMLMGSGLYEMVNFGYWSVEGAAFFSMGIYAHEKRFSFRMPFALALSLILIGFGLMLAKCYLAWGGFVLSISILPFLFGFISLVPTWASLELLRGYAFPLYLVHLNVVFVIFAILDHFIRRNSLVALYFDPGKTIFGAVVIYVVVIVISYSICRWLRTRLSFMRDVLWGGR